MAQSPTRVLTTHVPVALAEEIDQAAKRIERSRGWIIKQALTDWLAQEEERRRLIYEALEDVAAGRVVDHATVLAWVESLSTDNPLPVPRAKKKDSE